MLSVVNNLSAMNAQRQFNITGVSLKKSTEKLSSGYKINRAADDAAGLTISEKMRSLIRGMNQGSDNIQDGISVMQIADGALAEVHGMLHRMTELSLKAANGTETAADRAAIQAEINELSTEITRIGKSTTFNTMHILDKGETDPNAVTDKATDLVKCNSAERGYLGEYYEHEGKYYPAAILDFSELNESKIQKLLDKSFSFVCGQGCGETFKFTFLSGTERKLDNNRRSSGQIHNYTVGIDGITTGSDLVGAIYEAVTNNPLNGKGSKYDNDYLGGRYVSHATVLVKSGSDKLIVAEWEHSDTDGKAIGFDSREEAENCYPDRRYPSEGKINCTEITKAVDDEEFVNQFNIQCSNITDDHETIETYRMNAAVLGVDSVDVSTQDAARKALAKIDKALDKVSKHRSAYGAFQNRLEHSYANNNNKAENLTAAESQIRDTDMSKEMVEYTKSNILSQAGTAMLSQAMQTPESVLKLLS